MHRKEVNKCRHEWLSLTVNTDVNTDLITDWSKRWVPLLLDEIRRLRAELRRCNGVDRFPRASFEIDQDPIDTLVDGLLRLKQELPDDVLADVDSRWVSKRLDQILRPLLENYEGKSSDPNDFL